MGDLRCLDADNGRVLWSRNYSRDLGTEMNLWGMAAAPLVDGDRLIVLAGGKNHAGLVALERHSGRELWRALDCPDPGYSAPVIIESGGVRQLLVWCPTGLYSVDPATGKVFWSEPADVKLGHSIASPIFDPKRGLVFVTSFFNGPLMMKLAPARPAASLLWKGNSSSELPARTEGLHGLMATPAFQDGCVYGVCSYGHLRCLDALSGKRVWETLAATGEARWSTAFLVQHGSEFLLVNEHGDLVQAELSRQGYKELSRTHLIEPTTKVGGRTVVWSHPAFAHRSIFVRNDQEIVCVDLADRREDPARAEVALPFAKGQGTVERDLPKWVDEVQTYGMLPLLPQRAAELHVSVNGVWAGIGTDDPILPAANSVAAVRRRFRADAAGFVKAVMRPG